MTPQTTSMTWVYDDGGRAVAGFKGKADDCVARAIAARLPHRQVYDAINSEASSKRRREERRRSSAREGVQKPTTRRFLEYLGWQWHPTMQIGTGCKVHLCRQELPSGRLIVSVSRHVVAVIDHVIDDTHDPQRNGRRCVYGYYTAPEQPAA